MKHHPLYRLIKKLTFRKVVNLALVWLSFQWSRRTGRAWHAGMPVALAVEPTTACNLRCPECPSGLRAFTRPTGNLKKDFFTKIIDEQSRHLLWLTFYFQGEPFINPQFLEMVKYAHDKGIFTMTSTNGHFLNDDLSKRTVQSGLDKLIVSIDGTTQETYEVYRKEGKLEHVLQGVRNIVKWRKALASVTPEIVFQFLVVGPNEHQIPEVYALAKELGVDRVELKTAQVYDFENGHPLIPQQEKYSRYRRQTDGTYKIKNKLRNECWRMWHAAVITWDGIVVPCCFDKDAQYQMGNLQSQSFAEVWRNPAYRQFRHRVLTARNEIDICTNCTEGSCSEW